MKHLVIGLGEVGSAVREILQCDGYDKNGGALNGPYDFIHICMPWSDEFVAEVKRYTAGGIAKHKKLGAADDSIVIVHSTVPLGTCDEYGWVHSPIRGVHPNIVEGIKTFVKYFGGKRAIEASTPWAALGINVKTTQKAADTEALKLWDTTQYGIMIMLEKEIKSYCDRHELDFDVVYTDANYTYGIGYEALNRPEVVRPYLKHVDGPIGGHCVIPNAEIIGGQEDINDIPLVELLLMENAKLGFDAEMKQSAPTE